MKTEAVLLTWASRNHQTPNILYTAEYQWGSKGKFERKCIDVKELRCDFGKLGIGRYKFRVRAQLKEKTSDWVTTGSLSLNPKIEAYPPVVSMVVRDGVMELNITEPNYIQSCPMDRKTVYVKYWREKQENETWQTTIQQMPVRVPVHVPPSARLCVQVHILCSDGRASQPSEQVCENSKPGGHPSAALIGFLATLAAFSVLMLSWCVYNGRNLLYPNVALPHLLRQPPLSSADMSQVLEIEEHYQLISDMSEPLCHGERNGLNETVDGGQPDGGISVYASVMVGTYGNSAFHHIGEPADTSVRPEQRYYNMWSPLDH
ncbi:interferon lambda receptor 1-like isoform X2 [Engraulis encrasicolus]